MEYNQTLESASGMYILRSFNIMNFMDPNNFMNKKITIKEEMLKASCLLKRSELARCGDLLAKLKNVELMGIDENFTMITGIHGLLTRRPGNFVILL